MSSKEIVTEINRRNLSKQRAQRGRYEFEIKPDTSLSIEVTFLREFADVPCPIIQIVHDGSIQLYSNVTELKTNGMSVLVQRVEKGGELVRGYLVWYAK